MSMNFISKQHIKFNPLHFIDFFLRPFSLNSFSPHLKEIYIPLLEIQHLKKEVYLLSLIIDVVRHYFETDLFQSDVF